MDVRILRKGGDRHVWCYSMAVATTGVDEEVVARQRLHEGCLDKHLLDVAIELFDNRRDLELSRTQVKPAELVVIEAN